MENIASEFSYGDSQGGSNETGEVGFRPLVNVTKTHVVNNPVLIV
jgi:hypothetical protein